MYQRRRAQPAAVCSTGASEKIVCHPFPSLHSPEEQDLELAVNDIWVSHLSVSGSLSKVFWILEGKWQVDSQGGRVTSLQKLVCIVMSLVLEHIKSKCRAPRLDLSQNVQQMVGLRKGFQENENQDVTNKLWTNQRRVNCLTPTSLPWLYGKRDWAWYERIVGLDPALAWCSVLKVIGSSVYDVLDSYLCTNMWVLT